MKHVYVFVAAALGFIAVAFYVQDEASDRDMARLQRLMPQAHTHSWDIWVTDPVTGMILHKPVQCRVCINCGLQEYRTIEQTSP